MKAKFKNLLESNYIRAQRLGAPALFITAPTATITPTPTPPSPLNKNRVFDTPKSVLKTLSPPSTKMSSSIKDQGIYVGRLDITAFEDIKNEDDAKMWIDIVNELNFDSWLVETNSGLLDMGPINSHNLKDGYEGRRWHEDVLVRPYREGIDFPYIPLSALVAHGTTLYKKRCLEVIQYSLKTMTRIENTDVPVFVPDAYTTPPLKRSVEEKVRIDTTNVTSVVADAFTTPPSKRNEENTKATFANFDALNSHVVKHENLNLDSVAAEFEIARLMEENAKLKIQLQEPKIQLAPSKYEKKIYIEWLQDALMCSIDNASVAGSDAMLSSLYKQLRIASNAKKVADFRAFKKNNKVAFKDGLIFKKVGNFWNCVLQQPFVNVGTVATSTIEAVEDVPSPSPPPPSPPSPPPSPPSPPPLPLPSPASPPLSMMVSGQTVEAVDACMINTEFCLHTPVIAKGCSTGYANIRGGLKQQRFNGAPLTRIPNQATKHAVLQPLPSPPPPSSPPSPPSPPPSPSPSPPSPPPLMMVSGPERKRKSSRRPILSEKLKKQKQQQQK